MTAQVAADLDVSKIVDRAIRNEIDRRRPELDVLGEVWRERRRQDEKWGEQNHPDGTGPDVVWAFTGPASYVAQLAKIATDYAADKGQATWRDIALEELAEAFAEDDEDKLRTEVIQLAAVCVQWAQAIDRRRARAERAELDARVTQRFAELGRDEQGQPQSGNPA